MGLHVYCITSAGRAPDDALRGIDAASVDSVTEAGLALWVSSLPRRPAATAETVHHHNAVIAAAMDHTFTPVPARFGQWFDDEAAAAAHLVAEQDRWRSLLGRFAAHAEWGVRVVPVDVPAPAPAREMHAGSGPGTRYMSGLARQHAKTAAGRRDAEQLAERIADRLAGVVTDTRVETGGAGFALAHLVAWRGAEEYHRVLRSVKGETSGLRFVFTGPWAPYSFVE